MRIHTTTTPQFLLKNSTYNGARPAPEEEEPPCCDATAYAGAGALATATSTPDGAAFEATTAMMCVFRSL